MALGRMKPKKFSQEDFQKVNKAAKQQTGKASVPKSADPENYPVFEIPVNQKLLIYVPNHRVEVGDGEFEMRMDKGALHAVREGGSFAEIRCLNGIVHEGMGYDGTCPLCETQNEIWDLYRKEYAEICHQKGFSPDEKNEELKDTRIELVRNQVVKQGEVWYTFPIVVIDTEEDSTNPKLDADGKLQGTPQWYTIRERTYKEKWEKAFDALPEDDGNPAGHWFILNFKYDPKSGKHDKMGSARALAVTYKPMGDKFTEWEDFYNELTNDWTPQKSTETVIANFYLDMQELREVTDKIMKPVHQKLDMYLLAETNNTQQLNGNANQALESFGATETTQTNGQIQAPQNGQAQQAPQTPQTGHPQQVQQTGQAPQTPKAPQAPLGNVGVE